MIILKNYEFIIYTYKCHLYKFKPINRYSILISNPPYVDINETVDPKTKFEPQNAIFANDKGLEYYKYIEILIRR